MLVGDVYVYTNDTVSVIGKLNDFQQIDCIM